MGIDAMGERLDQDMRMRKRVEGDDRDGNMRLLLPS